MKTIAHLIFLNTNSRNYDFTNENGNRYTGTNHYVDFYDPESSTVYHIPDKENQGEFCVKNEGIKSNEYVEVLLDVNLSYGKVKLSLLDMYKINNGEEES